MFVDPSLKGVFVDPSLKGVFVDPSLKGVFVGPHCWHAGGEVLPRARTATHDRRAL